MWFTDSLPASQAPGITNTPTVIAVPQNDSGIVVTFGSVWATVAPVAKKVPSTRNGRNERQWRYDALVDSTSNCFCSFLLKPDSSGNALMYANGARASGAERIKCQTNAMPNVTAINIAQKCSKKSLIRCPM